MTGQRRPGRGALVLRDARALEAMRLRRKARRLRNLFFLLLFAGLFFVGFNRASVSRDNLFWLILAVLGIVLAFLPLTALLIDTFDINGTPRGVKGQDVVFFLLCALSGTAAATAILYGWQLFGILNVLIPYYIGIFFFLVALITALLIFLVRRRLPLPVFRQVGRQIFVALALWAILYFTLGQLSLFTRQHFTIGLVQLWMLPVFFLLTWPFFLLDEGINRSYQERGLVRALFSSAFFKILLLAGLILSTHFSPGLSALTGLLPWLTIILGSLIVSGTQIYSNGRAAIMSATFCALIMAWYLANLFPTTF